MAISLYRQGLGAGSHTLSRSSNSTKEAEPSTNATAYYVKWNTWQLPITLCLWEYEEWIGYNARSHEQRLNDRQQHEAVSHPLLPSRHWHGPSNTHQSMLLLLHLFASNVTALSVAHLCRVTIDVLSSLDSYDLVALCAVVDWLLFCIWGEMPIHAMEGAFIEEGSSGQRKREKCSWMRAGPCLALPCSISSFFSFHVVASVAWTNVCWFFFYCVCSESLVITVVVHTTIVVRMYGVIVYLAVLYLHFERTLNWVTEKHNTHYAKQDKSEENREEKKTREQNTSRVKIAYTRMHYSERWINGIHTLYGSNRTEGHLNYQHHVALLRFIYAQQQHTVVVLVRLDRVGAHDEIQYEKLELHRRYIVCWCWLLVAAI